MSLSKVNRHIFEKMDDHTFCKEYYENLQNSLIKQNITMKHILFPGRSPELWNTPDVSGYIKIFAYAVIMIGGLLGNLSVVLTVALVKSIRNTINFYVANLAVADAMICIVCMLPHALTVYTGDLFILGEFMCKLNPFTQTTCLTCSVLTLCAISCDRFMAVFRPLEVRTTEKRTSIILIVIWIISMAVSVPLLIIKEHYVVEWADFVQPFCTEKWPVTYYRDEKTNECKRKQLVQEIYYVLLSLTLFIVPVLIMFATYFKIVHKIWNSRIPGEPCESNIQAQSRSRHKVLKMVIVVLIVFVICWTPLQVTLYVSAFGLDSGQPRLMSTWYIEFKWFSYYIAYANSFINPFIYGQYNKDFRDGFCLLLHCGQSQGQRKGCCGQNIFSKSMRSMSTTFSSLKSGTHAFLSKSKPKIKEGEMQVTAV